MSTPKPVRIQHRERPILFSGPMVRAIIDGRKTQTRRVVIPQPTGEKILPITIPDSEGWGAGVRYCADGVQRVIRCPHGVVGDRLWARYSYWHYTPALTNPRNEQAWDNITRTVRWKPVGRDQVVVTDCEPDVWAPGWRRRPSIHMPRWASRIALEISGVRVEKVRDISLADTEAEGIDTSDSADRQRAFRELWDRLNAKRGYGWDVNPWVWVVEFRRIADNEEDVR